MKSFAVLAAVLSAVPFALGQQMMVNSLTGVVECEPILISWTGGTPPYYLSLIPAGQPAAPPLKQFPPQQGTSYTWLVDLPAGTAFTTELKDASGQPVYSGNQNIEAGSSTSCANTAVMESGSASGGAAPTAGSAQTPGANAASPTSTGSTSGGSSQTPAASHSSSASTSGASTTPTNNAAPRGSSVGAYGLAGLMGLVGAALF